MRSLRSLALSFCFVALLQIVACGGSSSSGGDDPTPDEALEAAKVTLSEGDVSGAYEAYTAIIGDGLQASVGKAVYPENAEARFGRAFTGMMLLIERTPSDDILASFGQEPWKLDTVLGENGILARSLVDSHPDKSALPFYNIRDCQKYIVGRHEWPCVLGQAVEGTTEQTLAASLDELTVYIDTIIEDLIVAIETASASYVIPKELFSGDSDISVNHSDMVQMLAGMYGIKAASDLSNSWTFSIDISTIVDANGMGKITKEEMVALLNDGQFDLRPEHKLATAKTSLQSAVTYSKQAVDEILAGATGGVLNLSTINEEMYQNFSDMLASASTSFSEGVAVVDIEPAITASLYNFFQNPPSAADIGIDPFVYENGRIRAVEAFWQEMIDSACDFQIGTRGTKVFTEAFRSIQRPYYQLFNEIMGRHFGKYRAGRGA